MPLNWQSESFRITVTHMDEELEFYQSAVSEEEYALRGLHHWLTRGGSSVLLAPMGVFVPYSIVLSVLFVCAVVFTPYMLYQLVKARWYKSVATFVVTVLVPFIVFRFVSGSSTGMALMAFVPFVAFYLYTWILRAVVGDYLREKAEVRVLEASSRDHRFRSFDSR